MRKVIVILVAVATLQLPVVLVSAQLTNASQQEFVESRSPLPDGGQVISRSAPGQGIQTRTMIANLPVRDSTGATFGQNTSQPNASLSNAARRPVYAYPAQNAPRTAQLTNSQATAYNAQTPFARNYGSTQSGRQTVFQNPAYGTQVAQNCCPPATQLQGTFSTPAALTPPSLDIQVPQTQLQYNPAAPNLNFQTSNFGAPAGNGFRNWWNPLITGSGTYQPVLRLQNMPPGTYLGQGIIGQPTAYVDGQPVRNLFRYVFP